jgi:hypothetical protein
MKRLNFLLLVSVFSTQAFASKFHWHYHAYDVSKGKNSSSPITPGDERSSFEIGEWICTISEPVIIPEKTKLEARGLGCAHKSNLSNAVEGIATCGGDIPSASHTPVLLKLHSDYEDEKKKKTYQVTLLCS